MLYTRKVRRSLVADSINFAYIYIYSMGSDNYLTLCGINFYEESKVTLINNAFQVSKGLTLSGV